MDIKTHKQPSGNDPFISEEVDKGGSLNTCGSRQVPMLLRRIQIIA